MPLQATRIMKSQRNMSLPKKQNKARVTDPKEIKIRLPDKNSNSHLNEA